MTLIRVLTEESGYGRRMFHFLLVVLIVVVIAAIVIAIIKRV